MAKVCIAVPTYKEIENIRSLLEEIFRRHPTFHVLVIDDNSPDGTGDLVDQVAAKDDRVTLIRRKGKLGLGSAYLMAFRYAMEQRYDVVVQMDADFSHHPKYLKPMLEALETHDVVIGSRYVSGGGVKNWGARRRTMSQWGSFYARLILGVPVRDLTGGFNAWRVDGLRGLPLERVKSEGYSFQIEMKYLAVKHGLKVVEIPIVFEDRTLGKSKMSAKIFAEAIFRVWEMRLHPKKAKQLEP